MFEPILGMIDWFYDTQDQIDVVAIWETNTAIEIKQSWLSAHVRTIYQITIWKEWEKFSLRNGRSLRDEIFFEEKGNKPELIAFD